MEIYFADNCGDTYRDSDKLGSAELHDYDVKKSGASIMDAPLFSCMAGVSGAKLLTTLFS